jgi:hypothetical protein
VQIKSAERVGQIVELLSRHSLKPFRNELDLAETHRVKYSRDLQKRDIVPNTALVRDSSDETHRHIRPRIRDG